MREVDYVHMLLERRVEGMVFICAEITDVRGEHSHYGQLLDQGARLVFVNGASESLPVTSVGVDERVSGRIATEHLLQLGHRRIGFVAGESFALATREKGRGRQDALSAHGVDGDAYVAYERKLFTLGEDGVTELMRLAGNSDRGDTSAMHAVWESMFRALVNWWLDHPDVTPDAMTDRCIRLFGTVFGAIDPAVLKAVGR